MEAANDFRIAVKAFVVSDAGELLLVKRRPSDVHKPGVWEIPGGRLAPGEDPFEGVRREAREEVGLSIEVRNPLRIHHFTRDDGQRITMIVFLCRPKSSTVRLSEEHTEHAWVPMAGASRKICPEFREEIRIYKEFFSARE